jgi:hypothetical protein
LLDQRRQPTAYERNPGESAGTGDFKETGDARVQSDPAFAQALLDEAFTLFVNGEPESAKLILRDLVPDDQRLDRCGASRASSEMRRTTRSTSPCLAVASMPPWSSTRS